ncbi:MAG: Cof-type HAD-IIB family hydrolase [Spirochaetales bacterium]|nr:Cof-type HAD-IIB family hydrolase [Spirochaetales bacterium]
MSLPEIQAVFFDFDHTLYSHKTKTIPQSAKDSIKILQKKGIRCVLATGRHMLELEHFPEVFTVGLDGYVTIDGQLCLDSERNVIFSNAITGKALEGLLDLFKEKQIHTILCEEKRMYSNTPKDDKIQGLSYAANIRHPVGEYTGKPIYLGIVYVTQDQEDWLHSILPGCNFLRWGTEGIDITPSGCDKVSGIRSYLDYYHIPLSGYMAFGDGGNDIVMLQSAPIGVAMGNAWTETKEVADYITTDVDDNGIWNALVHYGLI